MNNNNIILQCRGLTKTFTQAGMSVPVLREIGGNLPVPNEDEVRHGGVVTPPRDERVGLSSRSHARDVTRRPHRMQQPGHRLQ